jgi:hypothetical protein
MAVPSPEATSNIFQGSKADRGNDGQLFDT